LKKKSFSKKSITNNYKQFKLLILARPWKVSFWVQILNICLVTLCFFELLSVCNFIRLIPIWCRNLIPTTFWL
jgi:hypothetical protein